MPCLTFRRNSKARFASRKRGFWLQVGSTQVHVGTEDGFDRLSTKAHLAYEVEDVSYWKEVLIENDIKILESVPIPIFERFEFRDPFGNRVEMISNTKK